MSLESIALPLNTAFGRKTFVHADLNSPALGFWLSLRREIFEQLHVVICQTQAQVDTLAQTLKVFGVAAVQFPDRETLPYDRLPVQESLVSERIHLLSAMPKTGILLVSVQTLMQRIAPPSWLLGAYFSVQVGQRFNIDQQRARLIDVGYQEVNSVYAPGEFAVRGGIIDVFVMGQPLPLRLELFDDEIESIKFFDSSTQRTLSVQQLNELRQNPVDLPYPESPHVTAFSVLSGKEFPLHDKETFRQNFARFFPDSSPRQVSWYEDVMHGIAPSGIEYYLPLFFSEALWATGTLFDYLPKNSCLIYPDSLPNAHQHFWDSISARFDNYRFDRNHPILPPQTLYLPSNEFFAHIKPFAQIVLTDDKKSDSALFKTTISPNPSVAISHQYTQPLQDLVKFVANSSTPVLLAAESAGRREILLELLVQAGMRPRLFADFWEFYHHKNTLGGNVGLTVAGLGDGLFLLGEFCLISEGQIFGRKPMIGRTKKTQVVAAAQDLLLKSAVELSIGNLVVHLEHGIGRYQGLVVMDAGDGDQEFLQLAYADGAMIYVPITNLALVGRYSGVDGESVALSKIGSGKWDKARQKTLTQIYDVAAELLNVQARRRAREGIAFVVDEMAYELFASAFDYDETDDQRQAIEAVITDMRQSKPMDRLICGDVGFGKTEVAMRAAFIAVQAGYQVAVLVPTTLLAGQHEDSFRSRFADWPIRIESLSRFGAKKQQDAVIADMKTGKVDIVIGTHKLLQNNITFAKLGLMIVDEEHRFGVRHKERIKAMQTHVDSLFMTATPIPRTLNMALSGMQDISIIATPPARRLAIKTFVVEKNHQTIIDAVLREILRGGQVYYLHNDVASMNHTAQQLHEMIPEARIGVAHGQMKERELSLVMNDFYHKKTNVLLASTIIETGIDIPNANTIVIDRADKFGLAQLHQLRGRVGRSHQQAYCYLLVPSLKSLSVDAKKRLDAIARANTLGAGFMLASEDLEIRGAGELLGKEQSGNMQTIGFGLYMDMLFRATQAIKAGKQPKLDTPLDLVSDINLHVLARIPDDYLGDVHERLLLYKRLASSDSIDALNDLRTEIIDRFGALPAALTHLFWVHRLRIKAHCLGISKIDASAVQLSLTFRQETPIDGAAIVKLIQSDHNYRMQGTLGLRYTFKNEKSPEERFNATTALLDYFAKHAAAIG